MRRIQGQSLEAGGLTEEGRWQAQQLARRLRATGVDALYASDLPRAWETAQIVGAAVGLPVQLDSRWREMDLGVWQGMRPEEVDARWPTEQIWKLDLPRGETGETFAALTRRTLDAIDDLHARHSGQKVAVICHGGNVRAALLAANAPGGDGPERRLGPILNTSVSILQVNSAGLKALSILDASHLNDGELPGGEATIAKER